MEQKRPPAIGTPSRLDKMLAFMREYRALGLTQAILLLTGYWLYLGTPVPDMPVYLRLEFATHQAAENITGATNSPTGATNSPTETALPARQARDDYVIVRPGELARRPAFPGAEGYGAHATWGLKARRYNVADLVAPKGYVQTAGVLGLLRPLLSNFSILVATPNDSICNRSGAKVHLVTNTNNTGAGSFTDIIWNNLTNDTMDYVIFRTGGQISYTQRVDNSCVYIAGQTAPDSGFQIALAQASVIVDHLRYDNANEIIWRYFKVRGDSFGDADAFRSLSGNNQIFDHLSLHFGTDEVFAATCCASENCNDLFNVTLQWSIIGPTQSGGTGNKFDGYYDDSTLIFYMDSASIHHNLYFTVPHRNPRISMLKAVQVINNVTYNWKNSPGMLNGSGTKAAAIARFPIVDWARNYIKVGPWGAKTRLTYDTINAKNNNGGMGDIWMYRNYNSALLTDTMTGDQKTLWEWNQSGGGSLPDSAFAGSRQHNPPIAITEYSAGQAYDSVLAYVGASRRLDCDGTWVNNRDTFDTLIVSQVINNTGASSNEETSSMADYGGWPNLPTGTPCADTDSDGLPDVYETAKCGTTTCLNATDDLDGDGYINLEEYLNGTEPN